MGLGTITENSDNKTTVATNGQDMMHNYLMNNSQSYSTRYKWDQEAKRQALQDSSVDIIPIARFLTGSVGKVSGLGQISLSKNIARDKAIIDGGNTIRDNAVQFAGQGYQQ